MVGNSGIFSLFYLAAFIMLQVVLKAVNSNALSLRVQCT